MRGKKEEGEEREEERRGEWDRLRVEDGIAET